jgi:DNA-binding response OmpR family regulator
MRAAHILVVGGDPPACNALVRALAAEPPFLVEHAASVRDVIARGQPPDHLWSAVLADAPLPDWEVPEFCVLMRGLELRTPILIVGETAAEQEVVRALDAGAIDYLLKPVALHELYARLRAHIRRHEAAGNAVLPIGPYRLDPAARLLDYPAESRCVRLTHKETSILTRLYHAAGEPVSRQALLHDVWRDAPQSNSHTVDTHIYRLRRKIEPDPERPSIILNRKGGYCLAPTEATSTWPPEPMQEPALLTGD